MGCFLKQFNKFAYNLTKNKYFINERLDNNKTGFLYNLMKEAHIERYIFARNCISKEIKNEKLRILDAACGDGYGSQILADLNCIVYGIDKDYSSMEKRHGGKNITLLEMDCTNLQFPSNYFDFVVSFETIEHIKNCDLFLREIKRVLREDGTLILSTPNRSFCDVLFGVYANKVNPYHIKEFKTHELKKILEQKFRSW